MLWGRYFAVVGLVCVLAACVSAPSAGHDAWPSAPLSEAISADEVVAEVNAVRHRHGKAALRYNERLAAAAAEQARYQAAVRKMSHYGHNGARLEERLYRASYRYRIAGENVSVGRRSEAEVVNAWMNSPTHRQMMLHPEITQIGVAAAVDESGRLYWSMVMADPAPRNAGPVQATRSGEVVFW